MGPAWVGHKSQHVWGWVHARCLIFFLKNGTLWNLQIDGFVLDGCGGGVGERLVMEYALIDGSGMCG